MDINKMNLELRSITKKLANTIRAKPVYPHLSANVLDCQSATPSLVGMAINPTLSSPLPSLIRANVRIVGVIHSVPLPLPSGLRSCLRIKDSHKTGIDYIPPQGIYLFHGL